MTDGGQTTLKRVIAGVALQTIVGQTAITRYQFHDRLGSLIRLTTAAGAVVERMDFDGFGGRRHPDTLAHDRAANTRLSTRGYTGHEMIDGALGLIHMNARLFDPRLGRFLQVDPVVQAPENAQSWNAYTYVFNNPYAYTDPTGMIGVKERQWLAGIVAMAAAVWTGGASLGWWAAGAGTLFTVSVTAAFVSGAIASQSWKGGLQSAFAAALTFGVAQGVAGYGVEIQMAAQAVTGGVIESLQGGNFGNEFMAAGMTAALMPQVGRIPNDTARIITGALVGGTISQATGGKFANGAINGAIQAAMREPPQPISDQVVSIPYQDQEYVGKFENTRTPAQRQEFARAMVRRGNLGAPAVVNYVDKDPGRYMSAFPNGKIEVYRRAFEALDYYSFGSVLYHEYVHLKRFKFYFRAKFSFSSNTQPHYMMEAEAYSNMLTDRNPFAKGVNKRFINLIKQNNFDFGFGALTPENKIRASKGLYDCSDGGC